MTDAVVKRAYTGRLLSIREVARQLGLRFANARRLMESGQIKSIPVGTRICTTQESIDNFCASIGQAKAAS